MSDTLFGIKRKIKNDRLGYNSERWYTLKDGSPFITNNRSVAESMKVNARDEFITGASFAWGTEIDFSVEQIGVEED